MSVLVIRNDDDCEEVYNRTTVFCYTRMSKVSLWEYVEKLELLAEDRQTLFFKIDVDIFAAPECLPDLFEWNILSVVLKAHIGPFSFGILVKLFYELFPLKLMVDFSSAKLFISSGSLDNDGKALNSKEAAEFQMLSNYHKRNLISAMEVAESFKMWNNSQRDENMLINDAPRMLVDLAGRHNILGGYWIMFFKWLDIAKRENTFNILLREARKNWGPISRFNAKIASDNFIICFGNQVTACSRDPDLLNPNKTKSENGDQGPLYVRKIIDGIYEKYSSFFGCVDLRYKPDILSVCCVQRDNFIRPTVYQAFYGGSFPPSNEFRAGSSSSFLQRSQSRQRI